MEKRDEAKEYVLKVVKERNIKFIKLWFTDILGFLKSFTITAEELPGALERGVAFDGSSIEGFVRIEESDMIAMPDPSTFCVLPWRPKDYGVARMFCDILNSDGTPFEGDPRYVLRRNLKKAAEKGFTYYVGPELEYFYFKNSESTEFLDFGGYFDATPLDMAIDLRRQTVLLLNEMGINVEVSHHEVAYSQHEIDIKYADALTMADNVMTHKMVVKQVALMNGVYATFMPKPVYGINGSGMHVHQSLFKDGKNAFYDPNGYYGLSKIGLGFVAGLLKYAPEITAVTCQWVNSYKRLIPGYEAPAYICWGRRNRSALVRVPAVSEGMGNATRAEYRAPDPACNPYLAFSVMLAAGLKGIEENLEPPEPVEVDVYELTEEERKRLGIETLPGSLGEAITVMEKSELVRECLGDHVFESFIRNKKKEWDVYRAQVTEFEVKRYLPLL
ncbi:MAG: glutamine synthetase [Synergistetes bacterium]|nr:MAG: Glutamine synthetase, type I [bacterium 42_11]MBC7331351.1 glutamine synthetase [Synergistota bacterium]MDK2871380.1 glutamine synthetase [bacterium]